MIFEQAWAGFTAILVPARIGFMLLGIVIGNVVGFIPGLGGLFLLAMLIPFIFGLDPFSGLTFLLGAHAVLSTGGSVSAILFNTPGTPGNTPTLLDGFPMTQQGKAGKALGAALTASCLGGIIGAFLLMLAIPIMRKLAMAFSPPEYFMLTVMGIVFIGGMSDADPVRGLMSGLLGLLLSFIGRDPITGSVRFNLDLLYLVDGLPKVPVVVGLFAVSELIALGVRGGAISKVTGVDVTRDVWEGIRAAFRHWWLIVRCSVIAVFVGFMPGLGAEAAGFFTYGHAQQTSKAPETFGKGNIEGVIAPEAANNAKEGGALIPTLGFGIPGSAGMAILLGAFLIMGLTPGPRMLTENVSLVFSLAWTIAVANLIGALMTLLFASHLAKLSFIRSGVLIPAILVFATLGSYNATKTIGDLITMVFFGALGYWMSKHTYAKAPLILGLVLGRLAEVNLHLSREIFGPFFFLRPYSLILLVLILASLVSVIVKTRKSRSSSTF